MELFSIIRMASGASMWNGLDYWQDGRVHDLRPAGDEAYDAEVAGTAPEPYRVHVDIAHVRQSSCTCPHAAGTRRICKHMVATVFAAHPSRSTRSATRWSRRSSRASGRSRSTARSCGAR